ncbi:Protein kinase C-binding protein 1 [Habropoda laboriosa]|uniref:Protein kinase C-binding protein 1 n=1 Tax=Habropoda laboriosa TaxID=597456 RepID=A0A0L7R0D8_9HYME|nr:Protein kinase C-binding protein 1 [Habropoda laboriosa]
MASVETRKSSTSSSNPQSPVISKSQKEYSQLSNVQDEHNSINTVNKEGSKIVTTDTEDNANEELHVKSCDQKKNENEEDVIILENNKKEEKCNINKIEHVQDTESLNVTSSDFENDSKANKNENAKETAVKIGNSLKRTRRSFVTQEAELLLEETNSRSKRKKKNTSDRFCWRCHKESVEAQCSACPRSWHRKCIGMQQSTIQNWICGECASILRAENAETRSTAMAQLSVDQLCLLLKHVVERMREYPGSEPFWKPVELSEAPNYLDYVVKPMDLSLLESNVRSKLYGSTDAFMADAKWVQHNCIVFNTCGGVYTDTSKLTNAAKQMIKLARQEVSEIEACPDCYAHGRNLPRPQPAWFIEPCRRPHPLVWAKLKGFPFWPAKAMPRMNSQGFVDVRFFGEHDRAWVSPRDLYLYSEDPPVPLPRKRRLDMEECVKEITRHCRKLELVFGQFKFAPPKVQYNPHDPTQIKLMLPNYDPLHSNNCVSSQLSVPKKKPSFKKRLHVKSKSQSDSEKADNNSDTENKISNDFNAVTLTEANKTESTKSPSKLVQEADKLPKIETAAVTGVSSNQSMEKESKEYIQADKNVSAKLETVMKENTKPSTSKTNANHVNNESNTPKVEKNNNSEIAVNDNTKSLGNLSRQAVTSSKKHAVNNTEMAKKESLLKVNVQNKGDVSKNSLNSQENSLKTTESVATVYKPKTRIVDKLNAEKALKFITIEQNQKSNTIESTISIKEKDSTSFKDCNSKSSNDDNLKAPMISTSVNKTQVEVDVDVNDTHGKNAKDQSGMLVAGLNDGTSSTMKKSTGNLIGEKEKRNDVSIIQKASRDTPPQTSYQTKESKAKKSFPNKARDCPQLIPRSSTSALSNSIDSMVHISAHQVENCAEYQMLPPEAGPISARLYHGAQDLARKMARLMEEAYKEAAQETQNCESGGGGGGGGGGGAMSENHQVTVHFLRLQIERMRWQHQQQLAELKHNTGTSYSHKLKTILLCSSSIGYFLFQTEY